METSNSPATPRAPWNKGKLTGQKPPLKLCEIWAIRTRLQMSLTFVSSHCSILRSIASFERAISQGYAYETFVRAAALVPERW